jgi:hypothetical protein
VVVEFSFLTFPGVYTATIPDHLTGARELSSTVMLDGVPRNVQFGLLDRSQPGQVLVGEIDLEGSKVFLFDQVGTRTPDPLSASMPTIDAESDFIDDSEFFAQRFVYWKLSTGFVSTHFYPVEEGEPTLRKLLRHMVVSEERPGFPKVEFREPLAEGNIREPAERDSVTFHADGEVDVPWSLSFKYAGSLARDGQFSEAGMMGITRATAIGVTVFCDGPAARDAELRTAAEETAASLQAVPEDEDA